MARENVELEPETVTDPPAEPIARPHLIDLPAREIVRQVADPSVNSGGGVIAALTLSGAAASAELVLRLAARRKSLSARRVEIESLLDQVTQHRAFFQTAVDRDVEAFGDLVQTQREAKQLREVDSARAETMLQDSYVRAAEVPLELSRQALTFIAEVEKGLEFASKFTISDLGAAAVLARGAIDAALLTVDANLAYVKETRAMTLRAEMLRIRSGSWEIADRVWAVATDVIRSSGNEV